MQKLRLLFLLFICAQAANAQIKLTPKPAPQPAPVRTAPGTTPATARVNVTVHWTGLQTVKLTIDDRSLPVTGEGEAIFNLKTGVALEVKMTLPGKVFTATEYLVIHKSGGDVWVGYGEEEGTLSVSYESTRDRQEREAAEAAEAEEQARQEREKAEELAARPIREAAQQHFSANMVFIAGGTFTMGCTAEQGSDCFEIEKPAHQVTLSSFRMGKYEVTQAEWRAVLGNNPSNFSGCPECPVETVSWDDIQLFLQKLNTMTGGNYRLPTEAEWEYAARGGNRQSGTKYSGSDNIDAVAWYTDNSGSKTHPVGQKQANALGLYDMSGNVWEWCSDWYGKEYYSSSPLSNPRGPSSGSTRVFRGGSWFNNTRSCRVPYRDYNTPVSRNYSDGGFRLVSPGS